MRLKQKPCDLSVNVNKIATLRNSRGGSQPRVTQCAVDILKFGADGITVHPRPDERHIKRQDVLDLAIVLKKWNRKMKSRSRLAKKIEFNIEGYPTANFLNLASKAQPDQVTLVPDKPNVLTSNAGWRFKKNQAFLTKICRTLNRNGIRVSLFLDPFAMNKAEFSALEKINPNRVELYTEKYAKDFKTRMRKSTTKQYAHVAEKIALMGIKINAGHDLDSENLRYLLTQIPSISEVSIGHALICESLYEGFAATVKKYKKQILMAHLQNQTRPRPSKGKA